MKVYILTMNSAYAFEKDSFSVRHNDYSDDRTICGIEEVEVQE